MAERMKAAAVIVAAGRGTRAGGEKPKQFAPLGGRPMLGWSIAAFAAHPAIARIVVVAEPAFEAEVRAAAAAHPVEIAPGGPTRIASVRAGLARAGDAAAAFIHDAARPGLRAEDVDALLVALERAHAAAPALPVVDALKRAAPDGSVLAEAERGGLQRIQTPQAVRLPAYRDALAAVSDDAAFDDDLAVARAAGLQAVLVPGAARLGKVTFPEDFALIARLIAPETLTPRVGTGFDAHRFGPGDHVTLCGVSIPHDRGLLGHSDADAAWHALTDALLGAIGAGDIGDHFPPTDPRWKGAPSEVFLRRAAELVAAAGGRVVNVDVTVICERPRVKPHREAMRARTAEALGLPLARVSVKATTTEEMGFTGRREGLAAQASALVLLPEADGDVF